LFLAIVAAALVVVVGKERERVYEERESFD